MYKIITYYICKQCGGQTLFIEQCVWCGSTDFEKKERTKEMQEPIDINKKRRERADALKQCEICNKSWRECENCTVYLKYKKNKNKIMGTHFGVSYEGFCLEL